MTTTPKLQAAIDMRNDFLDQISFDRHIDWQVKTKDRLVTKFTVGLGLAKNYLSVITDDGRGGYWLDVTELKSGRRAKIE